MDEYRRLNGIPASFDEKKTRLNAVKSIIVRHPMYVEILKEIENCHLLSKNSIRADGLYIFGESGTGKTTVIRQYTNKFQRKELPTHTVVPVLRVELPSSCNPKSVAITILEHLRDPRFDRGTEKTLTARVYTLLKKCEVELIIFDEFQHFIDSDTRKVIYKAADWLKTFFNEINIPIVLCGLPAHTIFESNTQLDGRFQIRKSLDPFKYSTTNDVTQFRTLLSYISKELPFPDSTDLVNPSISDGMFFASGGFLRNLLRLIERATFVALECGHDSISESDLFTAFESLKLSSRTRNVNPFVPNFNLQKLLGQEKTKKANMNKITYSF